MKKLDFLIYDRSPYINRSQRVRGKALLVVRMSPIDSTASQAASSSMPLSKAFCISEVYYGFREEVAHCLTSVGQFG